ncbi:Membrane-associated guanylate kinase [Aphelenchoides bicaudatus]|nr:Membrane-associated guanylate kinase [Aphelenchoides bicaudatus]
MNNEAERFLLGFEYYFKQLHAPPFPRDRMMQNLTKTVDSLYRRARQLKNAKERNVKSDISLWEASQLLNNTNNHVVTPARKQLHRILDNSLIQNLFLAYDEISNYSEQLPPQSEQDETLKPNGLTVKQVNIYKNLNEPLGATIKAYPNGEIYVARVIVGGAADRCGSIQPGDQIIEVNDIPVSFKNPTEIIDIVQNGSADGVVSFKLVPNKESMIESTSSRKKTKQPKKFLRANFDYMGSEDQLQPCRQAALSFQNGDVLEILEDDDPYWMQARCAGHGTLITAPIENDDELTLTDLSLYESSKHIQTGLIPTELVLYKQKVNNMTYNRLPDFCYEPVAMLHPGENRPVVLIGAPGVGRNELKKRLIAHNPIKFASPVPHTSRPKRPTERQGVDYTFVSREDLEIVVLVEPPNFGLLRKTRISCGARSSFAPNGRYFNDQDFAQIISYSAQLSLAYGRFVDFRIVNGVLSDTLNELIRILHDYDSLAAWVPEQWVSNEDVFKNSVC